MPIAQELINNLSTIQAQIWSTVTDTVSEGAAPRKLVFADPLCVPAASGELQAELSTAMVTAQFSFANLPDNPLVIGITPEVAQNIVSISSGAEPTEIDENTVADLRGVMEGIVQGICLAIGGVRRGAVVATALTIRHQVFAFPQNMLKVDDLVRVQVALSSETHEFAGTLSWLIDPTTANFMVSKEGEEAQEDGSQDEPFAPIEGISDIGAGMSAMPDTSGIEILMDIPLEVSVELGHVKMVVKDVIELGTGSIIELDRSAGEPVDVMVNGRLVARGEVVVIEDNFGVRITEILNPMERLARLNEAAA